MATAVLGAMAAAATGLLSVCINVENAGTTNSTLVRDGMLLMETLTRSVRTSNHVWLPNTRKATWDILALSYNKNDDNDFYFSNPLFPRCDEDTYDELDADLVAGLSGIDDDNDGSIDETSSKDDDEDGQQNEDRQDGIDNDNDGNIDEDWGGDTNGDGAPGVSGLDDDGDGQVDEGSKFDDDEDGVYSEDGMNPVYFRWNGASRLEEFYPETSTTIVLSNQVTAFAVSREANGVVLIDMTLTGSSGSTRQFIERVCARNLLQKTGKRVR